MKLIKAIVLVQMLLFTTVWSNSYCLCQADTCQAEQVAAARCCGAETGGCSTAGEQLTGQNCFRSGNTPMAIQTPVTCRAGSAIIHTFLGPQTTKLKTRTVTTGIDKRARDCLRTPRLVALLI